MLVRSQATYRNRRGTIRGAFFTHDEVVPVVGRPGFEPGTNNLKGCCSTIELSTPDHWKLTLKSYHLVVFTNAAITLSLNDKTLGNEEKQ